MWKGLVNITHLFVNSENIQGASAIYVPGTVRCWPCDLHSMGHFHLRFSSVRDFQLVWKFGLYAVHPQLVRNPASG